MRESNTRPESRAQSSLRQSALNPIGHPGLKSVIWWCLLVAAVCYINRHSLQLNKTTHCLPGPIVLKTMLRSNDIFLFLKEGPVYIYIYLYKDWSSSTVIASQHCFFKKKLPCWQAMKTNRLVDVFSPSYPWLDSRHPPSLPRTIQRHKQSNNVKLVLVVHILLSIDISFMKDTHRRDNSRCLVESLGVKKALQ